MIVPAALVALLALTAAAAEAPLARTAGKVLKSSSKISPSAGGPVFREGRLTILDKAGHAEEFKATPRTTVTLDGKPAKFPKAAVAGATALKALYDPATKELASLDLKSGPFAGEVANTDILTGALSVRGADKSLRDFVVPENAKIGREDDGKPAPIPFEALQVGDAVEVFTTDGKTAVEIRARAAR